VEDGAPILREANLAKGPISDWSDLKERIATGIASGDSYELPQKAVLQEVVPRLGDLKYPPLPQQIDALGSRSADNAYRILRESDTEVGRTIQNLEGLQKAELTSEIAKTVDSISPKLVTSTDEVLNGNKAIDYFTEQYQNAKKILHPVFNALDDVHLGDIRFDIDPFMNKLAERVPGVARMFSIDESGYISGVNKYQTAWGIDKATYNAVKEAYRSMLSSAGESFSLRDFLNIRKGFDQFVNHTQGGSAAKEIIGGLKPAAMDYIQSIADEQIPEGAIREAFKAYAINEKNREIIEKVFGAQVGEPSFAKMAKPKEYILGKIFRDTETVKAAKAILPPHQFDDLLANWLAEERHALTKNGVFSSNRFYKFLKDHRSILQEAMQHSPQKLQRLGDLTTFATIVPDNASINPSGTAKTLIGMLRDQSQGSTIWDLGLGASSLVDPSFLGALAVKKIVQIGKQMQIERNAVEQFNNGLAGKAAKQATLKYTQKVIESVNANIDRAARAIFRQEEPENAK
jgi:hypothetical protein